MQFLVAGAQKGGTTALYHYLRRHPGIGTGRNKELHFFDSDARFAESESMAYGPYHALFPEGALQRTAGDFTPIYLYWKPCAARIWDYNPRMKLILLLRNPALRAYSHWNMETQRGNEWLDFASAIRAETERLRESPNGQHRIFSYVDRGRYAVQLRRLWGLFPRDQTLVLRSEDLRNHPADVLDRITRFLGVKPLRRVVPLVSHALPYPSRMSRTDRTWLNDALEEDRLELEQLLGWDCRSWRDASE